MTSDDYTNCVILYPDGKTKKAQIRTLKLDTVDGAVEKVGKDYAAWVKPEDVQTVLERLREAQTRKMYG